MEEIDDDWEHRFGMLWDEVQRIEYEKNVELEDYKNLYVACKKLRGIGPLSANHMLGIAATVGIIPLKKIDAFSKLEYKSPLPIAEALVEVFLSGFCNWFTFVAGREN